MPTINGYKIASGANLSGADLSGANLSGANLSGANLSGADLSGANLSGANLSRANLTHANLSRANLSRANLSGADLRYVNLSHADLVGAQNIPTLVAAQTIIAGEGDLIRYKKLFGDVICRLQIPAEAKRSNATGRKCRAEYAIVLEGEGVSQFDPNFPYRIGEMVRPTEPFDTNRWNECTSGIHFFLTREEAEKY